MRAKTTRAFRTISEAGDELGLQPHVLRFWESKFSDIKPIKRGGGRRFYRPEDIEFIRGIKTLLYDEKHPIKDVQKLIAKSGAARIVELGRSVEQASRERALSDMPLVPERLREPATDKGSAKQQAANSNDSLPELSDPPTAAIMTPPTPEVIPQPETPQPLVKPSIDKGSIADALSRLEALKSRWDDFADRA